MSEERDAEEIREILAAISDFLKGLKEPLMDIVNTVIESLSGDKLGADVASFYKRLVDAGMPESLAAEMTKEYMRKRLDAVPSLGSILESFGGMGRRFGGAGPQSEGIDKAIQALEKLKEEHPETKEKIEKAVERLEKLKGGKEEEG